MGDLSRCTHFPGRRSRTSRMANNGLRSRSNVWMQPARLDRSGEISNTSEYDAFCSCWKDRFSVNECTCGEVGKALEWVWDVDTKSNCTHLVNNNKDVKFHLHFSGGTAVIKGNRAITANQHYWEVKMTSLVYGTDMMVGIGTKDADIHKLSDKFCSVLGIDSETWGLSYTGLFHHEGAPKPFSSGFGQGAIIGVHLDMWNGTMSFYKNRQPLGVACGGLKGKTLYPMVSSTAARSGMRIIHSVSFPSSLQFLCCVTLRKAVSPGQSVFDVVSMPPGMQVFLANNLGWLLGECHLKNLRDQSKERYHQMVGGTANAQNCSHKHLTCDDCNTSVFTERNRADEDALMIPSHLLQIGPVLLQGCKLRASSSSAAGCSNSSANDVLGFARHEGSETKKMRLDVSHSEEDDSD